MPGYPFLATTPLDYRYIENALKANKMAGVDYTDEMIAAAKADLEAQANPDSDYEDLQARYPKAQVRDFDGNASTITELDALIAYLQMLGTLVEFDAGETQVIQQ